MPHASGDSSPAVHADENERPDRSGRSTAPIPELVSDEFERLFARCHKAAHAGNHTGACALLRALTRQYPHELRAWEYLAHISDNPDEQQRARDHIRALQSSHSVDVQQADTLPALETPVPPDTGTGLPAPRRWLYLAAGASVICLVLIVLVNTPIFQQQIGGTDPFVAVFGATPVAEAQSMPVVQIVQVPVTATSTPTPTPTPSPTPVPRPTLQSLGTLIEHEAWHATLMQPEHAQVLGVSVDGVETRGRALLTVLAVSNATAAPRPIPRDMFAVIDDKGRLYRPVAGASSTYLSAYGRGQHGDLALEDDIPPGGILVSVPLLFDIAPDATRLFLTMGERPTNGWLVIDEVTPSEEPTPLADIP